MALGEQVGPRAKYNVYGVAADTSLPDLVEIMAERGVRRLRVYTGPGYGYVTIRDVVRTIDTVRDPGKLANVKAFLVRLVYPPRIALSTSILESVRVMRRSNTDFVEVEAGDSVGIFTVTDVLEAIEPGELRVPAILAMTQSYPRVDADSELIDVVHSMRVYGVDAVLVVRGDELVGMVDSRRLAEALAHEGFEALYRPVYREAERVRCVVSSETMLWEASHMMSKARSSICIVIVRGYLAGVIDEEIILDNIQGKPSGIRVLVAPPMRK